MQQVTVTADSNYSGTLALTAVSSEIAAVDAGATITFSVTPAQVTLTPGQSAVVNVKIDVSTMAPSFTAHPFHIIATDLASSNAFTTNVNLTVVAQYDILMMGGPSPEVWSSTNSTSFINHPEGITVRFINMDSKLTHVVHSAGPIPHGDTANPLAASVNGQPGGIYSTLVTVQTMTSDVYYCHNHESGALARSLNFNQPVVPATTVGKSGNPNAKYSVLASTVFTPKCVTCHGNSGGITLSSYATVKSTVTAGNASGSTLYISVNPPGNNMPQGGAALSATDLKNISDWINDGALNN